MAIKSKINVERTLEKICSENIEKRQDGWDEIHEYSAEFRESLNDTQMVYLRNVMSAEKDPITYKKAVKALLALAMIPAIDFPRSEKTPGIENPIDQDAMEKQELLSYWLWLPFREPSAIMTVTATDYYRRDEGALIWLLRRLSFKDFFKTDCRFIQLEDPDVQSILGSERYQAFCIVGRLGLFGSTALERFGNSGLRFGFDKPCRPKNLPPGQLDSQYHCVFEHTGNGKRKFYRTVEKDNIRMDYAVVQRYQVNLGGTHTVVVIIIAGASSLGTTAGARWAALKLFQPTDAIDKGPIEVPPQITPHSRMEALLRVRAKVTTSAWEDPEIELIKLYVDEACWSPKDQTWHEAPIQLITVVCENGEPVEVLFDNEPSRLERGKQTFRLMVAMAQQVIRQGRPEIDIAALAADKTIWEKPDPKIDYVRVQLRMLRTRYLKEALCMRGTLKLRAQVKIVDKP